MPRKKETEKEPSLTDLAKKGLERIVELSQSQIISEKLQSVNILLFVLIATLYLTLFLGGSTMNGLVLAFIGVFCFVISLIGVLGYGPLLSAIVNVSTNKIEALRVGITILFISLTIGVAALVFDNKFLGNLSLGLLGLQIVIMLISSLFIPKTSIEDREIEPSQIWDALGKISSITGIIGFIVDIALILIKAYI
jgi:hypothetical protein